MSHFMVECASRKTITLCVLIFVFSQNSAFDYLTNSTLYLDSMVSVTHLVMTGKVQAEIMTESDYYTYLRIRNKFYQ